MRASRKGKHVSGQERIVKGNELERVILELHRRPKDEWDFQTLKVEKLKEPPEILERALPIKEYRFSCVPLTWNFVVGLLESSLGIKREITKPLFAKLLGGLSPKGGNLKGALLVDLRTGEILNPIPEKGIRTILFDWLDRDRIKEELLKRGYTLRTLDALALATKNIFCGVEAEVCLSDDPSYTVGYVATQKEGYIRLSPVKEKGNPFGGRIYFLKKENLNKTLECLRKKAILIKELSTL